MKRRIMLAALFAALPTPIFVQSGRRDFGSYGHGNLSWGAWTATARDSVSWGLQQSWVQGWVSAAGNYALRWQNGMPLADTDSDGIAAWMTDYCTKHPLDKIAVAASALTDELIDRARAKYGERIAANIYATRRAHPPAMAD